MQMRPRQCANTLHVSHSAVSCGGINGTADYIIYVWRRGRKKEQPGTKTRGTKRSRAKTEGIKIEITEKRREGKRRPKMKVLGRGNKGKR